MFVSTFCCLEALFQVTHSIVLSSSADVGVFVFLCLQAEFPYELFPSVVKAIFLAVFLAG